MLNNFADVVDIAPVGGHKISQISLLRTLPLPVIPLKITEHLLGQSGGLRFVIGNKAYHAIFGLNVDWANIGGFIAAKSSPFDHRRAGHADP